MGGVVAQLAPNKHANETAITIVDFFIGTSQSWPFVIA